MNTTPIYVSPAGHDTWSGRLPDANADGTDGPLRSLAAAQTAVRQIKARLQEPAQIRVELRGGRYELDEPWRFHAEDGGFGRKTNRLAQTWPVVWAAYRGEMPVISGGRHIPGPWTRETVNGRTVYTTTPPDELLEDGAFTQLWVNGERRERPRLPKQGLWQVDRGLEGDGKAQGCLHPSTGFVFQDGQISACWHNVDDVRLHLFGWWVDRHVGIRAIDESNRVVRFDRTARLRMEWPGGGGIDFVVENVFEALTEPGEWYLDRPAKKLFYLPLPDEDVNTAEVVVGKQPQLLRIERAAHLRFENLTFAHCEWRLPDDQAGENQAAAHVPAAIALRGSADCVFAGCRVAHVNTYGVEMLDGTTETILDRCTLTDLGAGGVRIWHGCRRNAVLDCEIGPGGLVFAAACGVLIGKAMGNRVEHCHIHDFYYTGISVGWTWGYEESDGYGNIIEWNHIHHLGKGLLSDMGGIYLLGHATGTRLRYNHIHDIDCRNYGGWCIYLDEGSTDVLVESNLCYRANRHALNQHYGRNNTVCNNILAYGGDAVLSLSKPEPHLCMSFERNILLSRDGLILNGLLPERWMSRDTRFERNLYWCASGPVTFERQPHYFATQPFPDGFAAEASRFTALGTIPPAAKASPSESEWDGAFTVGRFTEAWGLATTPEGFAELRFLACGGDLLIRGRMPRPTGYRIIPRDILWNREHIELFLKPFPTRPGMVQFGLDSDGEAATVWQDCEAPEGFAIASRLEKHDQGWQCEIRIPLAAIATQIGPGEKPDWRYLAGFVVAGLAVDAAFWREHGHDPDGVFADPLFVDPAKGDFRLLPDSPAFAMGFVPWAMEQAGPREDLSPTQGCRT
jgi:hypothetical protein